MKWYEVILAFLLAAVLCAIVAYTAIQTFQEIHIYNVLEKECSMNNDICFCDKGSCVVKYTCQKSYTNDILINENCKDIEGRLCEIGSKAKYTTWVLEYCPEYETN